MIIKNITKNIRLSKAGKPYASVRIQLDEYKDGKGNLAWISGFGNQDTWKWEVGHDVQPEIEENGKYYNFKFNDTKENALDLYTLPATIGFVMDMLASVNKAPAPTTATEVETVAKQADPFDPDNDNVIDPESIPF